MRILLLGAGGFIGRHILAELLGHGHDVTGVVRSARGVGEAFADTRFVELDLSAATDPAIWRAHVTGIDLIVNAAGVLRGRRIEQVHAAMPRALYAAAAEADVKRVVLLSAISARAEVNTDYARSKLAGEATLRASGLGWTILRPSLVYGDGSYGGTSLMRGMAGLPWVIPLPGKGDFVFTPIHVRDLARTVRIVGEAARFVGQTLDPVGPETITLRAMLGRYRAWLGFGRARFLRIPLPVMRLFGRIGDFAGNGPISTNSLVQMIVGNAGDSAAFEDAIGFRPRSLATAMQDRPAQVQDRWHARLFFLAPTVTAVLVLVWLASAWLGFVQGAAQTATLVRALGLPDTWGDPLRIGSSVLDLVLAAMLLRGRSTGATTLAQLATVLGYTAVIGIALPTLWLDPLGPLLKNIPILALILVHGAIADRR